ncbi:hypothetical protein D3C80_759280 [compost metagenome]
MHMVQRPILAFCIHRQGDCGAGAKGRQQQLMRIGTAVVAAQLAALISQPLLGTGSQAYLIRDIAKVGVNG